MPCIRPSTWPYFRREGAHHLPRIIPWPHPPAPHHPMAASTHTHCGCRAGSGHASVRGGAHKAVCREPRGLLLRAVLNHNQRACVLRAACRGTLSL